MVRYDKDGDGAISFTEFSDEIRPHSPYKRGSTQNFWFIYKNLSKIFWFES